MRHAHWTTTTILAAGLALAGTTAMAGTIVGSEHDFSADGWSGGEICLACHAPHNNQNATGELLWNHDITTASFTLYGSTTLDATPGEPAGTSKLCLSCHDGTLALDSFGGGAGTAGSITGGANFGTDLSNDHPISIAYDDVADGELKAPTTTVTIGDAAKSGTIAALLLNGGKVECESCHDVHNTDTIGGTQLLKMDTADSALCLACHVK